jgi:uncharacterized protein YbjT (DUF2867 family)
MKKVVHSRRKLLTLLYESTADLVDASGLAWTAVRPSWSSQNIREGFVLDGVLAGELALPVRDVREPCTDADDIAEVAVGALTDERHAGQTGRGRHRRLGSGATVTAWTRRPGTAARSRSAWPSSASAE